MQNHYFQLHKHEISCCCVITYKREIALDNINAKHILRFFSGVFLIEMNSFLFEKSNSFGFLLSSFMFENVNC